MPPVYTVVWTRKAVRMLERLPAEMQGRIVDQVESIAGEPFAYVRKVEGPLSTAPGRDVPGRDADHGVAHDYPRDPGRAPGDCIPGILGFPERPPWAAAGAGLALWLALLGVLTAVLVRR